MAFGTPQNFLSDLQATVMSGVELEIGDASSPALSNLLTVDAVKRLPTDPQQWPARLQAAYEVAHQSESMPVVFDALAVRIDFERWANRVSRTAWRYLMLVVAAMMLGLAAFYFFSSVIYREAYADLRRMASVESPAAEDPMVSVITAMVVGGCVGFLVLAAGASGGLRKIVLWAGGQSAMDGQQSSQAICVMDALQRSTLPMDAAIDLATAVVAGDLKLNQRLRAAFTGASCRDGIGVWARLQATGANQAMMGIELWLPKAVVILVGGMLSVFYCLSIYRPIIAILNELASAANRL